MTEKTSLKIVIDELMNENDMQISEDGLSISINNIFFSLFKEYANLKETCTKNEFAKHISNSFTKVSMAFSTYTLSSKSECVYVFEGEVEEEYIEITHSESATTIMVDNKIGLSLYGKKSVEFPFEGPIERFIQHINDVINVDILPLFQ